MNTQTQSGTQQTLSVDYFIEEFHRFRKIMCSTEYTQEYKDDAFSALTYVYFNVSQDDPKIEHAEELFIGLADEFSRRTAYMMVKPLDDFVKNLLKS